MFASIFMFLCGDSFQRFFVYVCSKQHIRQKILKPLIYVGGGFGPFCSLFVFILTLDCFRIKICSRKSSLTASGRICRIFDFFMSHENTCVMRLNSRNSKTATWFSPVATWIHKRQNKSEWIWFKLLKQFQSSVFLLHADIWSNYFWNVLFKISWQIFICTMMLENSMEQ